MYWDIILRNAKSKLECNKNIYSGDYIIFEMVVEGLGY